MIYRSHTSSTRKGRSTLLSICGALFRKPGTAASQADEAADMRGKESWFSLIAGVDRWTSMWELSRVSSPTSPAGFWWFINGIVPYRISQNIMNWMYTSSSLGTVFPLYDACMLHKARFLSVLVMMCLILFIFSPWIRRHRGKSGRIVAEIKRALD